MVNFITIKNESTRVVACVTQIEYPTSSTKKHNRLLVNEL
jgi:hypothetical protein